MIQDEYDPVIDFSWYYFIGRSKLCLTDKETGHLTLAAFNRLYKQYKDVWDMEMRMSHNNITYKELYAKARQSEEWF